MHVQNTIVWQKVPQGSYCRPLEPPPVHLTSAESLLAAVNAILLLAVLSAALQPSVAVQDVSISIITR